MSLFEIDLHPKKATINSCAGALFLDFVIARRLCPNITVRRAESIGLGRFAQKETKRTKGPWVFVSFVVFCGFSASLHGRRGFLFVCFACLVGTFPGAVARPAVTAISDRVGRRFLRLNEHYAEQGAAPDRHLRLGICLGVFGFHKSVCGGRYWIVRPLDLI